MSVNHKFIQKINLLTVVKMKSVQLVVFIFIIYCDNLIAVPSWDSKNLQQRFENRLSAPQGRPAGRVKRPSPLAKAHSAETFSDELENFQSNDDLSDKTFQFAMPMEFDNRINKIEALARANPLHADWLRNIIQMAKMNKMFASELSFSFLPMTKSTMRNLKIAINKGRINAKEKLLRRLAEDFDMYEKAADDLKKHIKELVEIKLFSQFDIGKLCELASFELSLKNQMNLALKTKSEKDTTALEGKLILEMIKNFKKQFQYSMPKVEYSRNPDICEQDMEIFFDLCIDQKIGKNLQHLTKLLDKLHNRQKGMITMLFALKKIAENQQNR